MANLLIFFDDMAATEIPAIVTGAAGHVVTLTDAAQIEALLESEPFDVAITEAHLAIILARALHGMPKKPPIIVIVGVNDIVDDFAMQQLDVRQTIIRPYSVRVLLAAVRDLLPQSAFEQAPTPGDVTQ